METTMNIRADSLGRIAHAARSHGISRSEMIVLLIKKLMDEIPEPGCLGTMVRYQKRRDKDEWRRLHVLVKADDYEYLLDLRKLLKCLSPCFLHMRSKNIWILSLKQK